eukprot:2795462-Alexandrium_andersonii.AAC.1
MRFSAALPNLPLTLCSGSSRMFVHTDRAQAEVAVGCATTSRHGAAARSKMGSGVGIRLKGRQMPESRARRPARLQKRSSSTFRPALPEAKLTFAPGPSRAA